MKLLCVTILLLWKKDIRNRNILLVYYLIPLGFWAFMGTIFTAINSAAAETLTSMLTVLSVSTGALLGVPVSIAEFMAPPVQKAYKAGGIPMGVLIAGNIVSAFLHISLVAVIIYFLTPLAFKAAYPLNIPVYFISLLLFLIASIALGTLVGLVVKNQAKITLICQAVYMPSIMLSGAMFDSKLLPEGIQYAGMALPARWGYAAMTASDKWMQAVTVLPVMTLILAIISMIYTRRYLRPSGMVRI